MAVFLGSTVIHRVAVNERRGIGETCCGIAFSLGDTRYDPNGVWQDDRYLDWLNEHRGLDLAFCSHCPNREPPWQSRGRMRRKAVR